MNARAIYTVGHSDREPDAFVRLLADAGVKTLADVRRYPHSRRHPWFNVDELNKTLFRAGIRYAYLGDELGGFRDVHVDSPNTALAGSSFQGYADHMAGGVFARGYGRLLAEAGRAPTAIMCAQANPKKCHRRLLADRLALDGWTVVHLLDSQRRAPHKPDPHARLDGEGVRYEAPSLNDF